MIVAGESAPLCVEDNDDTSDSLATARWSVGSVDDDSDRISSIDRPATCQV